MEYIRAQIDFFSKEAKKKKKKIKLKEKTIHEERRSSLHHS
jgi:hypothetical protein